MSRRRLLPLLLPKTEGEPVSWSPTSLLRGIAASYRFENAADIGHDDYGYCNVTASGGTTTQVTGKHAYALNAANAARSGTAATNLDPALGLTFCGWFKTDSNTGTGHNRMLLKLEEYNGSHISANPSSYIYLNSSGSYGAGHIPAFEFYDSSNTYRSLQLSAVADPTAWHFFCAKLKTGAQSFAIDNGTPVTGSYTLDTVLDGLQTLKSVGMASSISGDNVSLDSVLIYNRILTDDEINALYKGSSGRAWGFGWEATLSRATITADSTTVVSGGTLSRATLAADSTTAVTGGLLSRATIVADSSTVVSGGTLSRATLAADSTTAVTAGILSRATAAADSTPAVTPGVLSRATIVADSTAAFVTDPGTLSRATIVADSTTVVTGGVLSRASIAADSTDAVTAAMLSRATIVADSTTLEFVDPATLQRATIVATSNRTLPDISAAEFKYVVLSNILNQFGSKDLKFREETSNRITAAIKDEHGHSLDESDFDFVLMTLYDKSTLTLLTPTEVVTGGPLSITAGTLAWDLLPRYTNLIDDDVEPTTGREKHTCLLEFCHGTERVDDLTDAFTTDEDSNVIEVTHPAHDLVAGDHVWYLSAEAVGGLTLTGVFLVQRIIDANSYEVVAHRTATATASGGGATVAYRKGYSNKAEITFEVIKADIL